MCRPIGDGFFGRRITSLRELIHYRFGLKKSTDFDNCGPNLDNWGAHSVPPRISRGSPPSPGLISNNMEDVFSRLDLGILALAHTASLPPGSSLATRLMKGKCHAN